MLLPKFKYFDRPDLFSVFIAGETNCDGCNKKQPCFDATLFYGEETMKAICPNCLANGALNDRDIFTCEGDIEELKRQLQRLHPDKSAATIQKIARDKTADLEETTPKLVSWQDWAWPCAEGDYCTFIGFGSHVLYNRLAEGNDGINLFQSSLYYSVKEAGDASDLWDDAMPANAINDFDASQEFDTLFYVFRSLHSNTIVTLWDVA